MIGLVVGIAQDGVDAIPAVFDQFPRDFDAAVIVVLDPGIGDAMRVLALVRQSARMRVVHAVESLPLETGSIFALPTPQATRVQRLQLRIGPSASNWLDDLLASVSIEFNWRAVGVLLGQRFEGREALKILETSGGRVLFPSVRTPAGTCPHRELGRRVVALVERLRNRERLGVRAVKPSVP